MSRGYNDTLLLHNERLQKTLRDLSRLLIQTVEMSNKSILLSYLKSIKTQQSSMLLSFLCVWSSRFSSFHCTGVTSFHLYYPSSQNSLLTSSLTHYLDLCLYTKSQHVGFLLFMNQLGPVPIPLLSSPSAKYFFLLDPQ